MHKDTYYPHIRYITCSDGKYLNQYAPENVDDFYIFVEIYIAFSEKHMEIFTLEVSSLDAYKKKIVNELKITSERNKLFLDSILIIKSYNYEIIYEFIKNVIHETNGFNPYESCLILSKSFYWNDLEDGERINYRILFDKIRSKRYQ